MNREENTIKNSKPVKFSVQKRIKEILLLGLLGILLIFFTWMIFQEEDVKETIGYALSENEIKVMRILQELDGVGEANVVVYEEGDVVKSVVILCEGANNLRVVMDVREAVSTALNTEQKSVKIYLKKE